MRTWIVTAFLLVPLSAIGDDAIDKAISQLASENPTERDDAEKLLLERGEQALDRCRMASVEAKDAEVRARLARICADLERGKKLSGLTEIWKSAWFRLEDVEKTSEAKGWANFSAELVRQAGRKTWKFHSRVEIRHPGKLTSVTDFSGTCADDEVLTPLEVDCIAEGGASQATKTRRKYHLKFVKESVTISAGETEKGAVAGEQTIKFRDLPSWEFAETTAALFWTLPAVVERASLLQQPRVSAVTLNEFLAPVGYEIEFKRSTSIDYQSKSETVREYSASKPADGNDRDNFLVSDNHGLLKARFADFNWTRCEETEARKFENKDPEKTSK